MEKTIATNQGGLQVALTQVEEAQRTADDAVWESNAKDRLLAYLAAKRWEVETGGFAISAQAVKTDRESQAMIVGAARRAERSGAATRFKFASGQVVDLTPEEMLGLEATVSSHVAACFSLEADLAEEIEAGTITTIEQIEQAAWTGV